MIAHNPLHGSGRVEPHPALALGDDALATHRIGMIDSGRRQPASDEAPHAIPEDAAVLPAPRERAMSEPSHLERLLWQVPFGQTSSLRPLRRRLSGIVRRLPRYCRSVRLPKPVRHRRTSLDFPTRPTATAALGGLGTSRFPREVSPYVHGVSDRAGLWCTSRYRCTRWSLPPAPTASASRSEFLTRLNTRPARSPVNASTPPSRAAPHDSGPMWVADPLSGDFFIHYTSPVLTGAQGVST
jgi:hypothetical protein